MRTGTFRDASPENTATGSVVLAERLLVLRETNIAEAPDAIVLLTHGYVREGALVLGPLLEFCGTHEYQVPENVDASIYDSVTIWCEEYSVPMGYADLA